MSGQVRQATARSGQQPSSSVECPPGGHDPPAALTAVSDSDALSGAPPLPQLGRRRVLASRALVVGDVTGLAVAFLAAQFLATVVGVSPQDPVKPWEESLLFLATIPGWLILARLYGLYARDTGHTDHTTIEDFVPVVHLVTVGTWLVFAATWLFGRADAGPVKLVSFWTVAVASVLVGRAIARAVVRRRVSYVQNTLIVGAGEVGQVVARKLLERPDWGVHVVGFVDSTPRERAEGLEHLPVLGGPERIPELVRLFDVERVVVAFSSDSHRDTLRVIRVLTDLDVQVDIVPRLFETLGPGVYVHSLEGLPIVGIPKPVSYTHLTLPTICSV